MRLRLEPVDEYMHDLGPEPNFNESMYFNTFDDERGLGGFVRLGNRANEGNAEMTVCLYLPDGRVAFMFNRPRIEDNDSFAAGGLSFEVKEPFETLVARYDGTAVILDHPLEMADPKRAFTENPHAACTIDLTFGGAADPVGGEPEDAQERPGEEFARGHYEQLIAGAGTITVGEEAWTVEGYGLRDHSWGPRYWQAPWYYRWINACFGPDLGFMGSRIARREGEGMRGGFVWDGEGIHPATDFRISTEWDDDDNPRRVSATLTTADRTWAIEGEVVNLIPLRNRREGLITRIAEGMTEWTVDDRTTLGIAEYLDQVIDGRPVGLDE